MSCGADRDAFDLADVHRQHMRDRRIAALHVEHRFYEIGSLACMADTDAYLREAVVMR